MPDIIVQVGTEISTPAGKYFFLTTDAVNEYHQATKLALMGQEKWWNRTISLSSKSDTVQSKSFRVKEIHDTLNNLE